MKRRTLVQGVSAWALCTSTARAAPKELEQKRLRNRLELWANVARKSESLLARVTTTRESSLLEAPLVTTATLAFSAPSTLVLRDDGLAGSTTRIEGETVTITLNRVDEDTSDKALRASHEPSAAWMADRFIRMFAPGNEDDLVAGARTHVPRGRGYRIELMPERGSVIRKTIRSVTITLDPVAGAITQIAIAEAQGDRLHLRLTDHRQDVSPEDIAAVLEPT